MGRLKALSLAGLVALGAAPAAHAADLLPPAPQLEPSSGPLESSGWYLRGDVGVGINSSTSLTNVPNPMSQGTTGYVPTAYSLSNASNGSSTIIDLGFGYRFNNWLRADVTGEYRGGESTSAYDQLLWNDGSASPGPNYYVLRNFYHGTRSAFVGLFNGYVDLGTWYGLTPFVGAGVGVADSFVTGLTVNGLSSLYSGPESPAITPTGGYYSDGSETSLAWALMTGLSYHVNRNLELEMSYRYLNIGGAKSGAPHCFAATPGLASCDNVLTFGQSSSQDIRLGMRWTLGEAEAPMPSPPVVAKY